MEDAAAWASGSPKSQQQHRGKSCEGLSSRLGKHPLSNGGFGVWGATWHESGDGSPVSTPHRLSRLLNSGLFKVSEVQVSWVNTGVK